MEGAKGEGGEGAAKEEKGENGAVKEKGENGAVKEKGENGAVKSDKRVENVTEANSKCCPKLAKSGET